MIVYRCDLCDEIRECTQREIEHTEYDICAECWEALSAKLKGKGRPKHVDAIAAPANPVAEPTREPKEKPFPGSPPTIYGGAEQVH
ncbi:MAG TPA: hypothetical protein VFI95_16615 [Terriglobales bacterium]|nr:hypothetical protein [Terriglobales bacterium]